MQILICADAQPQVGTGHLRRMLTLAEALLEQGVQISVQTSALGAKIATDSGLALSLIIAPCQRHAVQGTLEQSQFDAVILDNYHWNAESETPLRANVPFLVVVDDLANRPHDADVLLDQNAHHCASDYDGLVPDHCQRLVGGQYCLLAAPFRMLPDILKAADAPIFVSLGGGDPQGDLVPVVKTLLDAVSRPLTIATGSHIADAKALQALAHTHPKRIELVFDSQRVATQMQVSQFAVAAGGTMTWERAALGLASLCLIVADNQADSTDWLAARDVHTPFDLRPGWSRADLAAAVKSFAEDQPRQERHTQNSRALIARDGAVRTAQSLLNSLKKSASG